MTRDSETVCPECVAGIEPAEPALPTFRPARREFLRLVGTGAAAAAGLGSSFASAAADAAKPVAKPADGTAEALIHELYGTLSGDQKKEICLPWDHAGKNGRLSRLAFYNKALNVPLGKAFTKAQQDLCLKIFKAVSSGDEGFKQLSRDGRWDMSQAFENCGVNLFGEPADGKKFAWLFSGHHITVRCDGDSLEGTAFGGPIYYGHSPNGYSERNIFYYQTKSVLSVYDALSPEQAKAAVVPGTPGELEPSVKIRPKDQARPGIAYSGLKDDQKKLIEKVMADILSPYRKSDVDEVMSIIKETGGMEKMNLAFYQDAKMKDEKQWHFWRLEGPGFVWNFRVLPHVHCYVNISTLGDKA